MNRVAAGVVIVALIAGCSTGSDQENDSNGGEAAEEIVEQIDEPEESPDPESENQPEQPSVPIWDEEGLEVQPRMQSSEIRQRAETTEWRESDRQIPDELRDSGADELPDSPGELLAGVAEAVGMDQPMGTEVWEQTRRILPEDDDRAVGLIMQWGFKDDAVAGADLRVQMRRTKAGWHVEHVEERVHCRRGATDDGLCL